MQKYVNINQRFFIKLNCSEYRHVKNGEEQTIETIYMNVDELLHFLQSVQNVSYSCILFV
jgi:hypothetical protein